MALVTAKGISSLLVPLLRRMLVLPNTVSRVPGGEFAGSNGDTVSVRLRVPRTANVQENPGDDVSGDFTSISETSVDVSLAHLFDGVNITDEELSLQIVDFGVQVSQPQLAAVATGAEDELATAMNDVPPDASFAETFSEADVEDNILAAGEALDEADVPADDRFMAVSPLIARRILKVDKFTRVDASGERSALRRAIIGDLYGFTFVKSNGLSRGRAVAYHRSGFAFATRTPLAPSGASSTAVVTDSGLSLRQIFQYNPGRLSDQSVVSVFAGASLVDADRVYALDTTGIS